MEAFKEATSFTITSLKVLKSCISFAAAAATVEDKLEIF